MPNRNEGTVYELVEGWTSPIDVDLRDDGAIPSGTLGGTVTLALKDKDGNIINMTGNVTIQDATNWRVRVNPDASDFVQGTYRGRFKVTDSGGKISYFPNQHYDVWIVHPETW